MRRAKWARFDEVSAWPAATDKPFPSRGHGAGQYEITVKLDPSERARYLELGGRAELPQGTVVAAFHRDTRTGRPGPIYVMQREAQGWAYSAFDAEGLATEHGVLSLCQRCHLESPSGGLFGLPRSLQQ